MQLVVSCEHASDRVPKDYAQWFASPEAQAALATHRGSDIGAALIAKAVADAFEVPYFRGRATRLLVELNRSLGHPSLWSSFTKGMPALEKERVLDEYYRPYRREVEDAIAGLVKSGGTVLHLSVHSFTPVLNGEVRNADIGLLYDPARNLERSLCRRWKPLLEAETRHLRVRMNYPYRGVADGFTTALRKRLPRDRYAGIELEINQALLLSLDSCASVRAAVIHTLGELLAGE